MEKHFPRSDIHIIEERWLQLKNLLEKGHKCDLSLVFHRNAEYCFRHNNKRMAMI